VSRATSTIGLAVVLAALGGYIYYLDRGAPDTPESTKEKVFSVSAADIEELTIKSAAGDTTRLQRAGDGWQMVEPAAVDADPSEPSSVASSLASLEIERIVEEKPASVADYGLDPPRIEVAFKAKGEKEPRRLHIGEKTPTGGDLYARRQGDPRVFLIGSFLENTFNKGTFELRDKRVLTFEREKVDRISVVDGGKTLEFTKGGDMEWNIAKPFAARGDFGSVDVLLSTVGSTQVQRFIADAPTDLAQYGLDTPEMTVTFAGGGSASSLLIGDRVEGTRYAKDSNRPLVFTVGDNLITDLRKDVGEFRRKDLFDFRAFTAERVEFTLNGAAIAVEKSKGKDDADVWKTAAGKTIDTAKTEETLGKFSGLRADSFQASVPAAAKTPELTVTAKFDGRTETVRFARAGSDVYAMREGEPGAAKVPTAAYEEAVKALDVLK
jgi:hypothetical protein